jgi:uncharacterized protein YdbL (DUF1318 family)
MKTFDLKTAGIFIFVILLGGCSIKPPEVKLTGEKTALEREIIGTYHQMAEDTWMVASTRSAADQSKPVMSSEKKKVLEALQQQAFNKDDVEEFKKKGYVGENNQGQLILMSEDEVQTRPGNKDLEDTEKKDLVNDIVQEENQCRQVVMRRVVELNESLKKAVSKDVLAVFAKMYQDNSPKGTWVQTSVGNWVKREDSKQ